LSESRYDQLEPALEILRQNLVGLGLPLRSFECEYGPSQAEVTLGALEGLAAADAMILFRSATRQILRRHGYHATFMCRPKLPNVMSSGWHLHQSFPAWTERETRLLRRIQVPALSGKAAILGGSACAPRGHLCALATPTINGLQSATGPYSLAPIGMPLGTATTGVAMLRVIGSPGSPPTRESKSRSAEPAAECRTSTSRRRSTQGLDGNAQKLDPGPSADYAV
jgi:glutamine synthetase